MNRVSVFAFLFITGVLIPKEFRYCAHALALLSIFPAIGESTYTKLSLSLFVYAIVEACAFDKYTPLVPLLLTNFAGVFASFHVSILLDHTSFRRMAEFSGWSLGGFHVRNFAAHIFPILILTAWFASAPRYFIRNLGDFKYFTGISTACFHLLWAFTVAGTLNLSHIYIPFVPNHWHVMWGAAVATHVTVGMILGTICM